MSSFFLSFFYFFLLYTEVFYISDCSCIIFIFGSFDEHSLIDLPTMLDKTMNVSGQKELFYVGHSQVNFSAF